MLRGSFLILSINFVIAAWKSIFWCENRITGFSWFCPVWFTNLYAIFVCKGLKELYRISEKASFLCGVCLDKKALIRIISKSKICNSWINRGIESYFWTIVSIIIITVWMSFCDCEIFVFQDSWVEASRYSTESSSSYFFGIHFSISLKNSVRLFVPSVFIDIFDERVFFANIDYIIMSCGKSFCDVKNPIIGTSSFNYMFRFSLSIGKTSDCRIPKMMNRFIIKSIWSQYFSSTTPIFICVFFNWF